MSIQTAVAASVRSPGLYLALNLLAGISSPGAAVLRGLLLACKATSSGNIVPDTELRQAVSGPDAVATALGSGWIGHLCAKRIFEEYPLAQLDVIGVTAPAGVAASGTFTFTIGTPPITSARTVTVKIAGRPISIAWLAGETVTQGAAKLVVAINALSADLPVVASNLAGVVTVDAKGLGAVGNDITISVVVSGGAPSDASVAASGATLASGTLHADPTTALATVANREYDFVIGAFNGNTDTNTAASTSGPSRVMSALTLLQTGNNAKLQQAIFGVTGALASAKTGAAQQNDCYLELVHGRSYQSLPAELAGFEAGRRMRMEAIDPAVNAIGTFALATLYPPLDQVTGKLTAPELEDALQSGLSPVDYNDAGETYIVSPFTSHFKDTAGNPDTRCLDVSNTSGAIAFVKDLRTTIPQEFKGAKLSPNLEPNDEPPPPNTVEIKELVEFAKGRARVFVSRGILDAARMQAAFDNGEFLGEVDPSDRSQANLVVPERVMPPLRKTSLIVNAV